MHRRPAGGLVRDELHARVLQVLDEASAQGVDEGIGDGETEDFQAAMDVEILDEARVQSVARASAGHAAIPTRIGTPTRSAIFFMIAPRPAISGTSPRGGGSWRYEGYGKPIRRKRKTQTV